MITVDVKGEVREALAAEGITRDRLMELVEHAVTRVLDRRQARALEPLEEIINLPSAAAARQRCRRDPALAALGVPVFTREIRRGKHAGSKATRLLFKRDEVLAYYAAKAATK